MAFRRHRLLALGVSITEQNQSSAFELDALLAVDGAIGKGLETRADREARR